MEIIGNLMSIAEGIKNFEGIDEKMKKLKRKCEHLKSKEEDVKAELEYAERLSLKKRRKVVETWLTNVERLNNEVEQMEQQVRERSWLPNLQLERKMERLAEEVTELDQQGQFPEGLTLEVHGNQQMELITTKLIGQTFQKHKDVIWDLLRREDVSKIGIYGMGGVGKTTLVTHVHNELCSRPNNTVSWVTVSQNFNIVKLQRDIANTIGLCIENEDDTTKRAAELARGLRKVNNFVLILDDVWKHFRVDEVGIPAGGNGFKMILTSRSFDVCRRVCDDFIKVEPLSDKDAWELFIEKLWLGRALSTEIEPMAKSIVKRCSGLPLAIISMAGSLREVDDIAEWRDALENLKKPMAERDDDDLEVEVFQVLKYSYDMLKDVKVQQCFLYCSLFPEDHKIERQMLIEHFIDEGFVDGLRSRQAEVNRGHTILNKLENVCLLQGGINEVGEKHVKMHDVVRSMGIKIGRDHFQVLAEAGQQLREILREEKWEEDLTKVSLMWNEISDIPSSASPKCPRLATLMLNGNRRLNIIPDCFFSQMPALRVLDLSQTDIENLPKSVCELVNLTALWLEGCRRLKRVPSLANLKELRRLNLSWSGIREVPQGMEMLLNLRYLNIGGTKIEMIPDGILPKLSCLQYLEINYKVKEVRGEEIAELKMLETLVVQFCEVENFSTYVRLREDNRRGPNSYVIILGEPQFDINCYKGSFDRVVVCIGNSSEGSSLHALPTDIESLFVERFGYGNGVCEIVSLKNGAPYLRTCNIVGCARMECVICGCCSSIPVFQNLGRLYLEDLCELRSLIGRKISSNCESVAPSSKRLYPAMFSSLRCIFISVCPKIKRLFAPLLLSNLKSLEELTVSECAEMVEIIGEASDHEDDENIMQLEPPSIPKLTSLVFEDLPELKRFCNREIVFDSLNEIRVYRCPKLSFNGLHHTEFGSGDLVAKYCVVNSRIAEPLYY